MAIVCTHDSMHIMNELFLPQQKKLIKTLQRKHIAFAALFGSRAKGLARATSDYDFLVEFNPETKYTLFDIVDIKYKLEDILHSKVDIVTTSSLNHRMKDEVLRSLHVLYDKRQG